jgi:hypothetical protein
VRCGLARRGLGESKQLAPRSPAHPQAQTGAGRGAAFKRLATSNQSLELQKPLTDDGRTEKVTKGKVLSNLNQVFFDLPAAAGTPPGLSSGSQPYWGGVNKTLIFSAGGYRVYQR